MRDLQKIKCRNCGQQPKGDEAVCEVCYHSDWLRQCDRHNLLTEDSRGCKKCGYLFKSKMYYVATELASVMRSDWEEARRSIQVEQLDEWADVGLGDPALASRLKRVVGEVAARPDKALTGALAMLNPDGLLHWRGCVVKQGDLTAVGVPGSFHDAEMASQLLAGSFPDWLSDLPAYGWVGELREQCRRRAVLLGLKDLSTASSTQWWWALAGANALGQAVLRIKAEYVTAKDERLRQLFAKEELTDEEAVTLATAPKEELLMVEGAWRELVAHSVEVLSEMEKRANLRPCSRDYLDRLILESEEFLGLVRKQKEQLRARQADLPEPPELLKATSDMRVALHQAIVAHNRARDAVLEVREFVVGGHLQRARSRMTEVECAVALFSDLSLGFVAEAEVQYSFRSRRLKCAAIVLAAVMILVAIVIKLAIQANTSPP